MNVSNNIKAIRTEKGITQAEVARIIGVERTNYHRLENRGEKLTIEQLKQIAEALGVTIIDILSWDESAKQNADTESNLTERVAELEESVYDKSFIIKTLRNNMGTVSNRFNVIFEHFADELKVGEFQTEGISEKQKEKDEKRRSKGGYIVYPRLFSDDDLYELVTHIHKHYPVFYYLMVSLADSYNIREDNVFAEAVINYEKERMKRMKL